MDFSTYNIDSYWLKREPAARTVLFVYAHPDDESFGNAGTILRYVQAGVAVHYVCATRGESGHVAPELLNGYADLGALRTVEQQRAAEALGLAAVHFLNYRDSGMAGSPDNANPNALIQQPLVQVAGKIAALIRALRPQVVVTFGPYGGYGHPDHMHIHKAAHAAFESAGNPTLYPEQVQAGLKPWKAERLYYSTFDPRFLRTVVGLLRLFGRDPAKFGRNGDVDLVRAAGETTDVTTWIDSAAFLDAKQRAWDAHHSQAAGINWARNLPKFIRRRLNGSESFTRIAPPWQPGTQVEHDLFG